MSLDYEKKKYEVLMGMVNAYQKELMTDREWALKMPIETENGFNIERENILNDIDEKMHILGKHRDNPYFAKLVFSDLSDGEEFQGYIGRLSIGEIKNPTDEKIVDWRAPISDLYYNGKLGETEYEALGKEYQVDLKLKRQVTIKEGEVKSIYDFEDKVSNDEFLTPYLTQSANNRLKSIVSTIQEEQNRIIRLPIFRNAIVQGVAGSGKTTVALHRLSYLMYNYKKQVKPEEYLIISPNEIFMNYISSILVDLEADKANSFSLNKMFEYALGNEYKILNKHSQYEYLKAKGIKHEYLKFKSSKAFAELIDKWLEDYKREVFCKPLVVNGVEVLDKDTTFSFFTSYDNATIETIANNGYKKLGISLSLEGKVQKEAFKKIDNQNLELNKKFAIKRILESSNYGYVKKAINLNIDIFKIYKDMITNIHKYTNYEDIKILQRETLNRLKNKELAYDDMGVLLYLFSRFSEIPYYSKIKAVLIDEAQDLPSIMFMGLKNLFKMSTFMIFGDIAQGIYSYQSIDRWEDIQEIINECELLYLNRSYRTSIEIMDEAYVTLKKLGLPPANNVLRHGEKVDYYKDNNVDLVAKQLELLSKEYNNTAIICKDNDELKEAEKALESLELVVLDENNTTYSDIKKSLLTVQTAKGLEFDSVIIYNHSSYTDNSIDLKLLYVAKTRALHKLIINGHSEGK